MKDLSVYIHFPFCSRRCGYCDFNTNISSEHLIPNYVAAVKNEVAGLAEDARYGSFQVHTIYLGGGTPSLVPPNLIGEVLNSVRTEFQVSRTCEITIEANPGTISFETADQLRETGINRVSIGMQSSEQQDLRVLDREHEFGRVAEAVDNCREAGLENISLDLIYGIPGQTLASWKRSLLNALSLDPEHLSLYGLTIEDGTSLAHQISLGLVDLPDEDLSAELYEWSMEHLDSRGYQHYEISNWGKYGHEGNEPYVSRHNRQYWMNNPYLGVGTGAHGFFDQERIRNIAGLVEYINQLARPTFKNRERFPAAAFIEPISRKREMEETMMMGLRLLESGVSEERFENRFGQGIEEVFGAKIIKLLGFGLVQWERKDGSRRLRLTKRAYLVANQVFGEFV